MSAYQQQQPAYHHQHPRTNSTISHTSCPPLSPTNNNNTYPVMAASPSQQQPVGSSTIGHDGQDNNNTNGTGPVPVLFSWPDPDNEQPHAVLVASFDNFLHHAMTPRPHARDIVVTLPVPPGRHTYKFLVNGIWKTHRFLHDTHPIEQSPDGVKYHVLHVDPNTGCTTASNQIAMADSTAANSDNNKSSDVMADIITPQVHKEEEKKFDPSLTAHMHHQAQTVFRSASSSADTSTAADSVSIPSPGATGAMADSGKVQHAHAQHSHHQHFPSYSLLTPQQQPDVGLAPRGTSFNTAPVMSSSLSPANGSGGGVLTGSTTGRRLTDADMDSVGSSDTKGDAKKARTVKKSGSGHCRDVDVRLAAMASAHDASTAGQQQRQRLLNNIGSTTHGFLHLHHHHQSGASIAGNNHNTMGSLHGLVSSTSASAAVAPSMSMAGDHRKSLLHRVGNGWRRRFSHRGGDGAVSELGGFSSSVSCSSSAAFANAQMAHASTVTGGGDGNMHHSLSRVNLQLQNQQQQGTGGTSGIAGVHDGALMNGSNGNDRKDRSASALFRNTERERGGGREQHGNIHHHHHQQHQYRSHHNVSPFSFNGHALFPSSSEPVVCRASVSGVLQLDDKENIGGQQHHHDSMSNHNMNHAWHSQSHHHPSNNNNNNGKHYKHHGPMMTMTPDRRKFRGSSNRSQGLAKVSVSMPMAVDQPRNEAEVHKQADNWRQMAKHLTDSLHDPSAARELLIKAISHREKHGLRLCSSNAQVHTDLARNLSKADDMNEAEKHLRIALDIFATLRVNPDTQADLKLYIGVMVDRQKKRKEAELLYRQALDMYKSHGFDKGNNNMKIAIKNLVLNLKKQDRVDETGSVYEQYGRGDD